VLPEIDTIPQKSPVHTQKIPIHTQKSPIHAQRALDVLPEIDTIPLYPQLQIQIEIVVEFEFVLRSFEILDLVGFGEVVFSVESFIPEIDTRTPLSNRLLPYHLCTPIHTRTHIHAHSQKPGIYTRVDVHKCKYVRMRTLQHAHASTHVYTLYFFAIHNTTNCSTHCSTPLQRTVQRTVTHNTTHCSTHWSTHCNKQCNTPQHMRITGVRYRAHLRR